MVKKLSELDKAASAIGRTSCELRERRGKGQLTVACKSSSGVVVLFWWLSSIVH